MKDLDHTVFNIQPYLISRKVSMEEKRLLYSLRSICYPAKMNFRKMFKGNLQCSLQCNAEETQDHIFENCEPNKTQISDCVNLRYIYGTLDEQILVVKILIEIDQQKNYERQHPTWRICGQDPCGYLICIYNSGF